MCEWTNLVGQKQILPSKEVVLKRLWKVDVDVMSGDSLVMKGWGRSISRFVHVTERHQHGLDSCIKREFTVYRYIIMHFWLLVCAKIENKKKSVKELWEHRNTHARRKQALVCYNLAQGRDTLINQSMVKEFGCDSNSFCREIYC